jgi:glycosyltransferase involved in cell wall biosynthesis
MKVTRYKCENCGLVKSHINSYNDKYCYECIDITTGKLKKEIVVVDDGSTDTTKKYLKKYVNKKGFNIIFKKENRGKGAALKTGFENSTGDIVLVQDADLEYDPNEYPLLIAPILEPGLLVGLATPLLPNMELVFGVASPCIHVHSFTCECDIKAKKQK